MVVNDVQLMLNLPFSCLTVGAELFLKSEVLFVVAGAVHRVLMLVLLAQFSLVLQLSFILTHHSTLQAYESHDALLLHVRFSHCFHLAHAAL